MQGTKTLSLCVHGYQKNTTQLFFSSFGDFYSKLPPLLTLITSTTLRRKFHGRQVRYPPENERKESLVTRLRREKRIVSHPPETERKELVSHPPENERKESLVTRRRREKRIVSHLPENERKESLVTHRRTRERTRWSPAPGRKFNNTYEGRNLNRIVAN